MFLQQGVSTVSEVGGGRAQWTSIDCRRQEQRADITQPPLRVHLTVGPVSPHRGEDYKNHVKCISEDQKYGGKGYEGKAHKGDIKQQAWVQVRSESSSGLS